jgi:hypothetical protein
LVAANAFAASLLGVAKLLRTIMQPSSQPDEHREDIMKYTIVFDIDDLLISVVYKDHLERILEQGRELMGEERMARLTVEVMDYPHLVFPGFYEMFLWLRALGHDIYFFSSGVEERNMELVPKLIQAAFGDEAETVMRDVRVFSRQHCFDTNTVFPREDRDRYMPFKWFGNYKKIMKNVVVAEDRLANTLLIEDDPSYMPKGEEENMILLPSHYTYLSERPGDDSEWKSFHKAYLLAGLLQRMFDRAAAAGIPLSKAAVQVQTKSETEAISPEALRGVRDELAYYDEGLAILRQFDPDLRFFAEREPAR